VQLVTITILREASLGMIQEKQINVNSNDNNSNNIDAEVLEQGDIYFFYRPKKGAQEEKVLKMSGDSLW
jgi:hypothetical protein